MSSNKKRLKRTNGNFGGQHANQERRALKLILLLESVINDKPTHGIPTSTENLADENNRKCLMDNLKILHKEGVLKKNPYFKEMNSVSVSAVRYVTVVKRQSIVFVVLQQRSTVLTTRYASSFPSENPTRFLWQRGFAQALVLTHNSTASSCC